MTEDQKKQITEIEEREKRATPGPWREEWGWVGAFKHPFLVRPGHDGIAFIKGEVDDFRFMLNARQDVPFLLDLVKEQQAEIERLKAVTQT